MDFRHERSFPLLMSRLALGAVAALLTQAVAAASPADNSCIPPQPAALRCRRSSPFADLGAPSRRRPARRRSRTARRPISSAGPSRSTAIRRSSAPTASPVNGHEQQGAAYVFTKTDDVWNLAATLTASDGVAFDLFGERVALSGNVAAIGAYQADGSRGAVYVFTGNGSHWTQKARLVADDGAASDCLGWSVAADGADRVRRRAVRRDG